MNVVVADDDPIYRALLSHHLRCWGFEPLLAEDGDQAWRLLAASQRATLAILDWAMPGADGPELCRRVRAFPAGQFVYAVLLTGRSGRDDVLTGLKAGADDYLTKPFDPEELYARLQVGVRVLRLQQNLVDRVLQLEEALGKVKQLQGLLPMCCYCKSIRNDQNYWERVEHYIAAHSELQFSHGICPSCYETVVAPFLSLTPEDRTKTEDGVPR
jgi:CheY-like chemotaxis protein